MGAVICAWCRQVQSEMIEASWTSHTICRHCIERGETFPESYLLALPASDFLALPFHIAEVDPSGCVRACGNGEGAELREAARHSLFDLFPWSELGIEPMFRGLVRDSTRGGGTRIVRLGIEPGAELLLVEMAYDPERSRGVISAREL